MSLKDTTTAVVLTYGAFSLFAAAVCFKWLRSTAGYDSITISATGGLAGFLIVLTALVVAHSRLYKRTGTAAKEPPKPVRTRPPLPEASAYDPSYADEAARREVQGRLDCDIDREAIRKAIDFLGKPNRLVALDIGCADGYVTRMRFDDFSEFTRIVGVDKNSNEIDKANRSRDDGRYDFRICDVEEDGFGEVTRKFGDPSGGGFDVVFCALTLHHLADPVTMLRSIDRMLKNRGVIIIRGSDDGSKLSHPHDQVMEEVLNMTALSPGASDRRNGRKLLGYLRRAGFHDVEMTYKVVDTVGLSSQDRANLFHKSFSYRADYLKKRIASGHVECKTDLKYMEDALRVLRSEFMKEEFYYMEVVYVAIARKATFGSRPT
jgi:SAM-dependent methyltransferase